VRLFGVDFLFVPALFESPRTSGTAGLPWDEFPALTVENGGGDCCSGRLISARWRRRREGENIPRTRLSALCERPQASERPWLLTPHRHTCSAIGRAGPAQLLPPCQELATTSCRVPCTFRTSALGRHPHAPRSSL